LKGLNKDATFDIIEFVSPDEEGTMTRYNINATFMLSNYECIFGKGCPGHFAADSEHTNPDIGCCSIGFVVNDAEEVGFVDGKIAQLTDEDWDVEQRELLQHHFNGRWFTLMDDEDEGGQYANSVTNPEEANPVGGGCIFANRSNGSVGSTGKTGCAFHHLADRLGVHYSMTKPHVCWQAPIKSDWEEADDEDGYPTFYVTPWDADGWGASDDDNDGTHDSWMQWWCMDTPDAFVGKNPLYQGMENELRLIMGDAAYEKMVTILKDRKPSTKMPGQMVNKGRPMLPLFIEGKTPARGV
jgi:hypothetical protein